jgi:hypothetical protein
MEPWTGEGIGKAAAQDSAAVDARDVSGTASGVQLAASGVASKVLRREG